ncbi:hypothetical protein RDI58_022299 [Solanum bulbocastanum]|uniref:Uncharacterized protein n=1 Tax=Solanum bulbocastanum TaxID=147425 RepID=A0AAN8Y538_SOLBU
MRNVIRYISQMKEVLPEKTLTALIRNRKMKNDSCEKLIRKDIVLYQKLDEVASTSSDKGSIEIDEFGDSNDDSLRGTSSTISNLGNDSDEAQENNTNLSKCEAMESITVSSHKNEMITKEKDEEGTYRK